MEGEMEIVARAGRHATSIFLFSIFLFALRRLFRVPSPFRGAAFLAVAHGSERDDDGVAERSRPRAVAGRECAHQQQIGPAHINT